MLAGLFYLGLAIVSAVIIYHYAFQKVNDCTDGKMRTITSKNCGACQILKLQAQQAGIVLINEIDIGSLDEVTRGSVRAVPALMHGCKVVAEGVKDVIDAHRRAVALF